MINSFAICVIEEMDHGLDGFLQGCAGGDFLLEFEGAAVSEIVDSEAEIWGWELGFCVLDRLRFNRAFWHGCWCGFTGWW